jgi:hypothetical protein
MLLKNSSNIEKNAYLWSKSAKKRNVRHVIFPIYEIHMGKYWFHSETLEKKFAQNMFLTDKKS